MQKTTTTDNIPTSSDIKADKLDYNNLNENVPREHVLRNILSFSASLEVRDSKFTGKIKTTSN